MTTRTHYKKILQLKQLTIISQRYSASLNVPAPSHYTRRKLAARYKLALGKHDRNAPYVRATRRLNHLPVNGQRTRSNAKTTRRNGRSEKT